MYYYQSLQVADTDHTMASKAISMRKYSIIILGNLSNKFQQPPLPETWDKMLSRQVKLLPTSKYVFDLHQLKKILLTINSHAVYAKTRKPPETNACSLPMPKILKRNALP
jgi:hypothetical protein